MGINTPLGTSAALRRDCLNITSQSGDRSYPISATCRSTLKGINTPLGTSAALRRDCLNITSRSGDRSYPISATCRSAALRRDCLNIVFVACNAAPDEPHGSQPPVACRGAGLSGVLTQSAIP